MSPEIHLAARISNVLTRVAKISKFNYSMSSYMTQVNRD